MQDLANSALLKISVILWSEKPRRTHVTFLRGWHREQPQADQAGNNAIAVVRMTNVTGKIHKAPTAREDGDESDSESSSDEEEEEDATGAPGQPPQSKKPILKVR